MLLLFQECVLIHFDLLRDTIDKYLKKHSFCDECTKMVNKVNITYNKKMILEKYLIWKFNLNFSSFFQAYTMLVEDEDVPTVVPGGCCNAPVTRSVKSYLFLEAFFDLISSTSPSMQIQSLIQSCTNLLPILISVLMLLKINKWKRYTTV